MCLGALSVRGGGLKLGAPWFINLLFEGTWSAKPWSCLHAHSVAVKGRLSSVVWAFFVRLSFIFLLCQSHTCASIRLIQSVVSYAFISATQL